MKIPKIITKNNREYIAIKEYERFVLYREKETGYKECFNKQDIGLLVEMIKPHRTYNNEKRYNY